MQLFYFFLLSVCLVDAAAAGEGLAHQTIGPSADTGAAAGQSYSGKLVEVAVVTTRFVQGLFPLVGVALAAV
jgi:hypothetical protein